LISKNGGRHVNFRHQAEKDKTHQPKKILRVKSKKKMSNTFKKRTRNVRKSKKIKIGGERVSLVSLVMQTRLALGEKIPSSSAWSLSPKSSLCFFVRGPIGPRRRRWRKTRWSRTHTVFKRFSKKIRKFVSDYSFYSHSLKKNSHTNKNWEDITKMSIWHVYGVRVCLRWLQSKKMGTLKKRQKD